MSTTRRPFFCGNWKMHKTVAEALALATAIRNAIGPTVHRHGVDVAVATDHNHVTDFGPELRPRRARDRDINQRGAERGNGQKASDRRADTAMQRVDL